MGVVFFGGTLVNMARGLPLQAIATIGYDSTMGNLVLADSPIREPKDFEGRRVGTVATSAEAPYWAAYAEKTGIDLSKVTRQQLDARLIERALMDKQVDAITAIGTSSIPVLESLDILYRVQPEIGLAKGGKENAVISHGLTQTTMVSEEAINNDLGYSSIPKLAGMISLAARAGALTGDAKPLVPEDLATNRFAGKIKLSTAEWEAIRRNNAPYFKMVGAA
ncbi:MAG: ABC transporter substrate-binding protein [Burkholderiaceae bacterium]